MLFKQKHLHGIKAGDISLAFRKWKKPLVNKGMLLKTSVGQIEILLNLIVKKIQFNDD